MVKSFEQTYPNIAYWVQACRWVEVGSDEFSASLARAPDIGGMVWEGNQDYETLDEAMQALDSARVACIKQFG